MVNDSDRQIEAIIPLLTDLFVIETVYRQNKQIVFSLAYRADRRKSLQLLRDRLKLAGYRSTDDPSGTNLILTVDPKPRFRIPPLNIILFVATLFSVYFVPVFLRNLSATMFTTVIDPAQLPTGMIDEIKLAASLVPQTFANTMTDLASGVGIEFTLAMISILFIHEMGHFVASRRRNIVTSWPYFIPAPNIIGTFGAIIKSKSPFRNRRDLIEVGAAGPIAGWLVAVGWLIYGLSQSSIVSGAAFQPGALAFSLEGESIFMRICGLAMLGPLPNAGHFYHLTEAAFAGWVGLLVTAINLLPMGQLDGGHIIYGLAPRSQKNLGKFSMVALVVLGLYWPGWWLFAAFGLIFGVAHPPTLDDTKKPDRTARLIGIAALIILALSLTPVPFR